MNTRPPEFIRIKSSGIRKFRMWQRVAPWSDERKHHRRIVRPCIPKLAAAPSSSPPRGKKSIWQADEQESDPDTEGEKGADKYIHRFPAPSTTEIKTTAPIASRPVA